MRADGQRWTLLCSLEQLSRSLGRERVREWGDRGLQEGGECPSTVKYLLSRSLATLFTKRLRSQGGIRYSVLSGRRILLRFIGQ